MNHDNSTMTSVSLLARIRRDQTDPHAWREFVDRYGRRIYEWCLNRRLQPADAEDVAQNVLAKLAVRLGSFDYDSRQTFRGWLRRMTENALIDFFRERKHKRTSEGKDFSLLNETESRADLAARLEEAFDLEIFEEAKSRVQSRVDAKRWQAWQLLAEKNESGERVAEQLNMKIPTVYSSRYQIQKMISDEVRELDSEAH